MNMEYTVNTNRTFDEVVSDVEKLAGENNFRVLHVHDVKATLAEKGFERESLKIMELCNSKFAHGALQKNINVSLFMPCKVNIYVENGKTKIKVMRPSAIAEFIPGAGLDEMAGEVDQIIIDIVDKAAAGD